MSKHYSYVSHTYPLQGQCCMTPTDQAGAIAARFKGTDIEYGWSEDHSLAKASSSCCSSPPADKAKAVKAQKRTALELAISALKEGDVLIIWSVSNLMDGSDARKDLAFSDVLQRVAMIQELGASIFFVHEEIETQSASGRFNLRTLLASQQYAYDVQREKAAKSLPVSSSGNGF